MIEFEPQNSALIYLKWDNLVHEQWQHMGISLSSPQEIYGRNPISITS